MQGSDLASCERAAEAHGWREGGAAEKQNCPSQSLPWLQPLMATLTAPFMRLHLPASCVKLFSKFIGLSFRGGRPNLLDQLPGYFPAGYRKRGGMGQQLIGYSVMRISKCLRSEARRVGKECVST